MAILMQPGGVAVGWITPTQDQSLKPPIVVDAAGVGWITPTQDQSRIPL